jgi:SAM-dependent methyltransferase
VLADLVAVQAHDAAVDASQLEADEVARAAAGPDAAAEPVGARWAPFVVRGVELGRTFFRHGAHSGLPAASYDVVFSSHNLEHYPNPVGALEDWRRLLKADGHGTLVLVLPWSPATFDRSRAAHNALHLLEDWVTPSAHRLLHSHYDEMLSVWQADAHAEEVADAEETAGAASAAVDAGPAAAASAASAAAVAREARRLARFAAPSQGMTYVRPPPQHRRAAWVNDLHWHVFDFPGTTQVLQCLGFEVQVAELVDGFHMLFVARRAADHEL